MPASTPSRPPSRYKRLIESIFFHHWKSGLREFTFERSEFDQHAKKLGLALPANLGDNIYALRFRTPFPDSVKNTAPEGFEWTIQLAGTGRYKFKLVNASRIQPNPSLAAIKIPDSTPEIIRSYALGDEQALLAIVRYNRLIDTFLGLTTFSLQSHLRTTVRGMGQIEIDELYIGLDKFGCHYVIPVQAKVGRDQIGVVQVIQDMEFALQKFPGLRCRAISAQFMKSDVVALFEVTLKNDQVKIVDEKHYQLAPASDLNQTEIRMYR